MTHRSKAPGTGDRGGGGRTGARVVTACPHRKNIAKEFEQDAELAEAIRIGRERLGEDHPLVQQAIKSLRAKERRRVDGFGDVLTAEVSAPALKHQRHSALASLLTELLGEAPINEALLPGYGKRRADMYFVGKRLVVEEDGRQHRLAAKKARDAVLQDVCDRLGLSLLRVDYQEPLTQAHLRDRLHSVGL